MGGEIGGYGQSLVTQDEPVKRRAQSWRVQRGGGPSQVAKEAAAHSREALLGLRAPNGSRV